MYIPQRSSGSFYCQCKQWLLKVIVAIFAISFTMPFSGKKWSLKAYFLLVTIIRVRYMK